MLKWNTSVGSEPNQGTEITLFKENQLVLFDPLPSNTKEATSSPSSYKLSDTWAKPRLNNASQNFNYQDWTKPSNCSVKSFTPSFSCQSTFIFQLFSYLININIVPIFHQGMFVPASCFWCCQSQVLCSGAGHCGISHECVINWLTVICDFEDHSPRRPGRQVCCK